MLKILCQEETYVYNAYHMGKAFYPSEPVEASAEEKASHYVVLHLPSGKVLALDEEPGEKEEKSIRKRRMDRKLYQALARETGRSLAWGILTGVRPTKIAMGKREEGMEEEAFLTQMRWASEAGLPVIIHVREAFDTVFRIMDRLAEEGRRMKGVFHAFSGSIETYRRIRAYGDFRVGIGGVLTYKNAGIAGTVKEIPLEDIVLETDSPWLTPVPFRGKRNESAYLRIIAERLADIKGLSLEEVDRVTTDNTKTLFNIK